MPGLAPAALGLLELCKQWWKWRKSRDFFVFEKGTCLETGKRQNILNTESVWKQENDKILWIQKESGNRKLTKSFEYGKSLETGKWQNPLNTERVWKQGNDKIPWIRKVSRNRDNSKILWIRKVSRNRQNSIILWIRKVSRNRKTLKSLVVNKFRDSRGAPNNLLDV